MEAVTTQNIINPSEDFASLTPPSSKNGLIEKIKGIAEIIFAFFKGLFNKSLNLVVSSYFSIFSIPTIPSKIEKTNSRSMNLDEDKIFDLSQAYQKNILKELTEEKSLELETAKNRFTKDITRNLNLTLLSSGQKMDRVTFAKNVEDIVKDLHDDIKKNVYFSLDQDFMNGLFCDIYTGLDEKNPSAFLKQHLSQGSEIDKLLSINKKNSEFSEFIETRVIQTGFLYNSEHGPSKKLIIALSFKTYTASSDKFDVKAFVIPYHPLFLAKADDSKIQSILD
jgi:hypothetical protein